ncbi:hypothetical protein Gpo141_00008188, partial [Globisporangium polare]
MHRLRALRSAPVLCHLQQQRWTISASHYRSSSSQQAQWSSSDKRPVSRRRHQYISLYNYTALEKERLPKLRQELFERWSELQVLGRIYISQEGVNAQLVLPETKVPALTASFPALLA